MSSTSLQLTAPLALLLALLLAACAQAPAPVVAPPELPAAAAQGLWTVDAGASSLRILVLRGGRLAALGHNHVLGLPALRGGVQMPARLLDLSFRLDALEFDRPAWRAALGPDFASQPDADAIAATRRNMLIALEAERFPLVRLRARDPNGDGLRLELTLHGQTRVLTVPLQLDQQAHSLRARSRFTIRQSDFGIQPFSVLGGLLAVQDELRIEADLLLRP
ncbi:YceI family protein [Paucibacter soli]|uniref:YceI family protein n=1 Tax=Paucibacter soli TaxID=3133433 RepID=UPI0030AD2D6E